MNWKVFLIQLYCEKLIFFSELQNHLLSALATLTKVKGGAREHLNIDHYFLQKNRFVVSNICTVNLKLKQLLWGVLVVNNSN